MAKFRVELVRYDMDKTKKRKRANFTVDHQSERAIVEKLERIHKGETVQTIHEVIWGEDELAASRDEVEVFTGQVKFFDETKGFGFIRPNEKMEDLFFHASALKDNTITDNDHVQFSIGTGTKGKTAIHIELLKD